MTYGQFFYTLGLGGLLSLCISVGTTSYMLNQRGNVENTVTVADTKTSWEDAQEAARKLEQKVQQEKERADEQFSKYAGAKVINVRSVPDLIQAKAMIEEGKLFCQRNSSVLLKVKFYGDVEVVPPSVWCANGDFK